MEQHEFSDAYASAYIANFVQDSHITGSPVVVKTASGYIGWQSSRSHVTGKVLCTVEPLGVKGTEQEIYDIVYAYAEGVWKALSL